MADIQNIKCNNQRPYVGQTVKILNFSKTKMAAGAIL